jgi:hypothetical protein
MEETFAGQRIFRELDAHPIFNNLSDLNKAYELLALKGSHL